VIDGAAIGLVELPMIANDLAQGRLVRLFEIGVSIAPAYAYHLVYPARSSQDPRILAFSQWMRNETAHTAHTAHMSLSPVRL